MKQGRTEKNSYSILDSDISISDDIISHYAYGNASREYLTFLSSGIILSPDPNNPNNYIYSRDLYVLCIDPWSQKIMPFKNTSIADGATINIFYIKSK